MKEKREKGRQGRKKPCKENKENDLQEYIFKGMEEILYPYELYIY